MTLRSMVLAAGLLAPLGALAQPVSGPYLAGSFGSNAALRLDGKASGTGPGAAGPCFVLPGSGGSCAPASGTSFASRNRTDAEVGWAGTGSLGWGFGFGLRTELEGSWRSNRFGSAAGLYGTAPRQTGRVEKYGAMVNALFDSPISLGPVYPYAGFGLGVQTVQGSVATPAASFLNDRALAYTGATSGAGTATTIRSSLGSSSRFAWQAIGGAALPLPVPGLVLTGEYRYLSVTGERRFSSAGANGGSVRRLAEAGNHTLLLGLRWSFGG